MIALIALAAALAANPAPPKSVPGLPDGPQALLSSAPGGFLDDAKVGEWVTYRMDGDHRHETFWRLAVVGEEKDPRGRPARWVEMEFGTHHAMAAPILQWRALVARGKRFDANGVTKMYIAYGTGRPQEVAGEGLERMFADRGAGKSGPKQPKPERDPNLRTRQTPPTQLMTLAGTVTATGTELVFKDTIVKRIWVSDQIPLLKLAKIDIPAIRHSMEVRDYGVDAKPRMVLPSSDVPKLRFEPGSEYPPFDLDDDPGAADGP